MLCPTCEAMMAELPLARMRGLIMGLCPNCGEVAQEVDGAVIPVSDMLTANALGDDRIRAAVSKPKPSTLSSFLETVEKMNQSVAYEQSSMTFHLRSLLAQIQNRLDFGLAKLTHLEFIDDEQATALRALREARDLVSTLPSRNRGVRTEKHEP